MDKSQHVGRSFSVEFFISGLEIEKSPPRTRSSVRWTLQTSTADYVRTGFPGTTASMTEKLRALKEKLQHVPNLTIT